MLDIKIYKQLTKGDIEDANVATKTEFAQKFAQSVSDATGITIEGRFQDDYVFIKTDSDDPNSKIFWYLEDLGLSFGQEYRPNEDRPE